jgi:hypothetical protein
MSNDIIDRLDKFAKNWTGESFDPESFKANFHLFAPGKRAEMLDQFDEGLRSIDTGNIRRYAQTTRLRADLDVIHHKLRQNGR